MRLLKLTVLLSLLVSTCLPAEEADTPLAEAEAALRARDYPRARALLQPLAAAEAGGDYASLLLGNAHFYAAEFEPAIQAYDRVLNDFPDSPWREKALFKKAEALTKLKAFAEAADLLQPEVEHLVSDQRKEEVAASYLKYADHYFKPEEKDEEPDYGKARSLYEKALALGLTPEKAAHTRLMAARCLFESDNFGGAAKQLRALIKEHPDAKALPEAKYYLGLSYLRSESMSQARNTFRDFLEDYPQSPLLADVSFALCETYHVPAPRNDRELELGVKALRAFVDQFGQHDRAIVADYFLGASYFNRKRFEEAVTEFRRFGQRWQQSDRDEVPQAVNNLGLALAAQKRYDEALEVWNGFLTKYANHHLWNQVHRQIIDTEYLIGEEAYLAKDYAAALAAWKTFEEKYPLDVRNPDLMFRRGMIEYDQEHWAAARAEWEKLTSKYPGAEAASRAWLLTGEIFETQDADFDKALEAYGKVTQGRWQQEAQRRLTALKQKKLVLFTERTLTTAEEPVLKVVTRNVEELEFRTYQVDLVDYFKRLHKVTDLDKLDLALIEPDEKWTLKVPGYAPYKEIETEAKLPFTQPGVYALTCTADKLETTTVVMVSDLNIITKLTKKDALIFAENVRETKPYPGATVLLSDGTRILATGQTNEDGVFQVTLDPPRDAPAETPALRKVSNLRALVFDGTHYAATASDLRQLKIVAGLEPRGLVYTDRPTYRRGQLVHLRGIARKVKDGEYVFDQGAAFNLSVTNPAGVTVHQATVTLSNFGTFEDQVSLPPDAVTGAYTVTVREAIDAAAPVLATPLTFSGSFAVQEYQLERVRLTMALDKRTYLRGDEIKGTVSAKYYYGEPLAGRKVRFGWDQEPGKEYETDAAGSFAFTVTTRRFDEEQTVTLWARLEEESLTTQERIYVAPVALQGTLKTVRDVFQTGEAFDVEVKTTDLAGEPAAVKLELHQLKREKDKMGRLGEREVAVAPVQTSAEGAATVRVSFDDSGDYLLRLQGADDRGNPFTAEKQVKIVGEDDEIKLRLLADADTYKVGETPKIKLLSRVGPQLCLLTQEGDQCYGYQVVRLHPGLNEVPVALTAKLAPRFALAAAMMDGDKFYTASKVFNVERKLTVTLTPEKPKYQPGQRARVTVTVADQNGRPVAAELSVAAVNEALYALAGDPTPDLGAFFYRRPFVERAVRTATSCTFNYTAQAKQRELQVRESNRAINLSLGGRLKLREQYASATNGDQVALGEISTGGFIGGGLGGAGFGGGGLAVNHDVDAGSVGQVVNSPVALAQPQAAPARSLKPESESLSRNGARFARSGEGADGSYAGRAKTAAGKLLAAADMPTLGLASLFSLSGGEASPVRRALGETAFWNGTVVTGADGQATVEFDVPEAITEWRLTGRGVTVETLVGQGQAALVSAKPFLVELKAPPLLQQGDNTVVVAEVHNNTDDPLKAVVLLNAVQGKEAVQSKRDIQVAAHARQEVPFEVLITGVGEARLTVAATAGGGLTDATEQVVPIRPWGLEFVDSAGGTAKAEAAVALKLPDEPYLSRELEITLGPSVDSTLIEAAQQRPERYVACSLMPSLASYLPARLESLSAAARYLRQLGRGETPEHQALMNGIRDLVTRLLATQNEDGGWSWARSQRLPQANAQKDPSEVFVTSQAVSALAAARALGVAVPPEALSKASTFLNNRFQAAQERDYEEKLALLSAQTAAGEVDFAYVNRLYRARNQLDARGLAVLMEILVSMNRVPTARELQPLLEAKLSHGEAGAWATAGNQVNRFGGDEVETTAHALLALAQVDPNAASLPDLVRWLWGQRLGASWATDQATAAAVQALTHYYGRTKPGAEKYTLDVSVNGSAVHQLVVDGAASTVKVPVPQELLTDNTARVEFQLNGRGEYTYSCVLRGFSSKVEEHDAGLEVDRTYVHPPVTFEGKPVRRGFSTVEIDQAWTNYAKEIAVGRYAEVNLNWRKRVREFNPGGYVVLREPLPAGCQALSQSLRGNFERYERRPGELLFFFRTHGESWPSGHVSYQLYARSPGVYKALPARVWSYYQPDLYAYSKPGEVRLLERGQQSRDPYRLTPDEQFYLGKAHFDAHHYADAEAQLAPYYDEFKLRDEPSKETARMLFYCYLDQEQHSNVVRFFEVLNERHPSLVIPFKDIVAVARAYRNLGERERQIQVYRATAAASFDRESRVAGVLNDEGEFEASVQFMRDLVLSYPDVATTQLAYYNLSQFLYEKAGQLEEDDELKQAGVTKEQLIARAAKQIQDFLALYPEDALCDEASFSLANAWIELGQFDRAIAWCQSLPQRYPNSAFQDDFEYIQAYGRFLNADFDPALTLCQRLATENYLRPDKTRGPSSFKALALYIAAQIYHSRGQAAQALKYYEQVAKEFTDAREAIDYFKQRGLTLPEVTLIHGDDPAELKIGARNVSTADLKVYKVDLLKFYQLHRNLKGLAQMNLAGIKPYLQQTVTLAGGEALTDHETSVTLDLPDKGAYFVVLKAEGASGSGLILRTDLTLEVQEEPASGRVRVNVVNKATGGYEPKANVWVVGSGNKEFVKGESDLRGLLIAEDVRGTATVIASKDGQYAFHRGATLLQPEPAEEAEATDRESRRGEKAIRDFKKDALDDLAASNSAIQSLRRSQLEQQFKGGQFGGMGGVQVDATF